MSGAARRAEPGQTWWGRAWVEALEQRARLDPNRLPRGRDYARGGSVGQLVLAPGEVRAQVQGRKTVPYEVRIRVRRVAHDRRGPGPAALFAPPGPGAPRGARPPPGIRPGGRSPRPPGAAGSARTCWPSRPTPRRAPGNSPSAGTPTPGSVSPRTPTWPAGPGGRSAAPPSPR